MVSEADFPGPTHVVFGRDMVDTVGDLIAETGAQRAWIVTDEGVVSVGHLARLESALARAGVKERSFQGVHANPTSTNVDACVSALGEWQPDVVVGLGGGSSIDVAKGFAFLHAGGGRMEDYWGLGKARGKLLPIVAIPTTAGTGTEVQSFALIEQDGTNQKMACGDPQAAPSLAVLDPTLTVTMPRFVTACTGLDTVAHAVESAVTSKRNDRSTELATEAFVLAQANFQTVLAEVDNLDARGAMLRAAAKAGLAIENSMLGAAHSMANALTARYQLAHGLTVSLALPHVVRWNGKNAHAAPLYRDLAAAAGLCSGDADPEAGVVALAERLEELLDAAGFERALATHGVVAADLDHLADDAARQWTAQFNPRHVTVADFHDLFATALPL